MNLRLDIQGLRALAVLLVIVFHINENVLPGGFIGVDIFFVISGFLISKSILNQLDNNQFNLFQFFVGRVKRIVPAFYVMIIACTLVAIFFFPGNFFDIFYGPAKHTIFFLSNRVFSFDTNYFGSQSFENLLLHTWSLSIEMQFYIILPFILLILPKKIRVHVLIFIFLILLTYTEYNIRFLGERNKMYFSLPARSLEFLIGIFVNFFPNLNFIKPKIKNIISFLSFLIILLSAIFINETTSFPGLMSLPCCIGAAMIIWMENTMINSFFSSKIMVYIGKISYSLYLWHWPILAFYRFESMQKEIPLVMIFLLVTIFIILTLISFYFVEEPFRKLKGFKMYKSFALLALLTISIWVFSFKINEQYMSIPRDYIKPIELTNHQKYDGYKLIGDTLIPDNKIFLLGDSHCHSMRPFFSKLGKEKHFNFSFLSMNRFPPVFGFQRHDFQTPIEYKTYQTLELKSDSIFKKSKIIIFIRQWHEHYSFEKQFKLLISKLNPSQSLVVLSDYPSFDVDPVRRYKSFHRPIAMEKLQLRNNKIDESIMKIIENKKNVYFLDITDNTFFKDAPYFNDTLMYYDSNHINFYGSKKLEEFQGDKVAIVLKSIMKQQLTKN